MNTEESPKKFHLSPADNRRLADLCGPHNHHLNLIESYFNVQVLQRGNLIELDGQPRAIQQAHRAIVHLYEMTAQASTITADSVFNTIKRLQSNGARPNDVQTKQKPTQTVTPRNENQRIYLEHLQAYPLVFGLGPAGTGKTFLAVASAVEALQKNLIKRLIIVRPAVEAGEKLGFLPGDLEEKVLPYLRPIYDALEDLLDPPQVAKMLASGIIEIAPLAFMRGRTLNDAYIILDEAQNTTIPQMKMFLTRIGFGSTAVVTGDVTQVDLPKGVPSGLIHAQKILQNSQRIKFSHFQQQDVVRHPLVKEIIQAYAQHDTE